ncbi:hypothetical protein [Arthrobacter sp. zg-Y1110]|uniref:hypothetical protein n=1 Tax=Arthrobacter sp. zg-Y1110 TaxID=2886932 RepID=UPI001D13FE54|nr:hypothetical protein [Arthrobacter sp. zg-Y1110]MCC3292889.1 hypothetical protein [Arthrobacter sp. zg-Y1110]UWX86828.1 hypothetical protein N2K99_18470 [Arthrobacter sp. zg-Y1110]
MTNKTKLEQIDELHEGFTILEGNLRFAINDVKEHQRTLELILLAQGLLETFPGAGLLRVEIRDGFAVPVQLTDKPAWKAPVPQGQSTFPTYEVPTPTVIAQGRALEKTDIEGWTLAELLEEINRGSDGTWINRVDALPDIDTDYEDPSRLTKAEFDIDLAKAAALPVPVLGAVTVPPHRNAARVRAGEEALVRLRAGILREYPEAYMLCVRYRGGSWSVKDLVDETGHVLGSGAPLAAGPIPGGTVRSVLGEIPVGELRFLVTGIPVDEPMHEGGVIGILMDPARG